MSIEPEWYESGLPHVWRPQTGTASRPLALILAEGSRIVLADGRELVDGLASWGAVSHGYNHPYIRAAIQQQLAILPHAMAEGLVHEQALTLAARLADILPGGLAHVVFSDCGPAAVGVAMEMAMQYWRGLGVRDRASFVVFKDACRGETIADEDPGDQQNRTHITAEQFPLPLPRDEATEAALDAFLATNGHEIAGIIVEPLVQVAGGVIFHDEMCLARIRRAADRHNLILIFDERFTGFARIGPLFACEAGQAAPDIIVLGNALSGGTLPVAATVATSKIFDAFQTDETRDAFPHAFISMANPLACAAANASLDLFRDKRRCLQAAEIGKKLTAGLGPCVELPGVNDVRVRGAVGVVELERIADPEALARRFVEAEVWVRPVGNTVFLTPALTIEEADLSQLTKAVSGVLKAEIAW